MSELKTSDKICYWVGNQISKLLGAVMWWCFNRNIKYYLDAKKDSEN